MKAQDLRAKTVDELLEELVILKRESFNMRFGRASGSFENTARMRGARRDAARVLTVLREKQSLQVDEGQTGEDVNA